jgi:prephenate dehydrogenase
MTEARESLSIFGFGSFGQFMARHLACYFDVLVWDRVDLKSRAEEFGVRWAEPAELVTSSIVVHAVPVQNLESLLLELATELRPGTLFVDVASVKMKPLQMLSALLPESVDYLGLHPMFGPQSGRDGIAGLQVALCEGRGSRAACVREFLTGTLQLEVLEMTAETHDRQIAYVQGLTHWMAKALRELDTPEISLDTPAFRHLMKIEEILGEDSWELFLTIQRENPFAAEARQELVRQLARLEERLEE